LVDKWIDAQPPFEKAHYLEGFGYDDGRFRFSPDWSNGPSPDTPPKNVGVMGPVAEFPKFPDQINVIETADAQYPFRLATSPARNFLNSTFAETKTSLQKEGRPELMICPDDAERLGIIDGDIVRVGNARGAKLVVGARAGVLIAEGLWPNKAHLDGEGINVLTGADAVAPYGGAAFHDNKVWLEKESAGATA
jgi:anaerobic selenocysteine-containing dehydrogenase